MSVTGYVIDCMTILFEVTSGYQAGKFVKELGQIMGVQVLIEAPMNSSSPYFSSAWRRDPSFKVKPVCLMQQLFG